MTVVQKVTPVFNKTKKIIFLQYPLYLRSVLALVSSIFFFTKFLAWERGDFPCSGCSFGLLPTCIFLLLVPKTGALSLFMSYSWNVSYIDHIFFFTLFFFLTRRWCDLWIKLWKQALGGVQSRHTVLRV